MGGMIRAWEHRLGFSFHPLVYCVAFRIHGVGNEFGRNDQGEGSGDVN
jgi:hypothetical protein